MAAEGRKDSRCFYTWSLVTLVVFLTRYQVTSATNPVTEAQLAATNCKIERSDDHQEPDLNSLDANFTLTLPKALNILSRSKWLARPLTEYPILLQLPVPYVIIMHTAQENCSDIATCTFHVQQAQSFHMDSRGWDDIGYNFLIGGDGNAYEGRGWKSIGVQVYGYNAKCIGIAFIGTFNQVIPPKRQIVAAKRLIEIGVEKGYIAKDYKLLTARQLQTTQSPGLLLYEDVKKWPHWSPTP